MADILISIDASGVIRGKKVVDKAFDDIAASAKKATTSIDSLQKEMKSSSTTFQKSTSKTSKNTKTLDASVSLLKKGVKELNSGLIDSSIFSLKYGKALSSVKAEIKETVGANKKLVSTLQNVNTATKKASDRTSIFGGFLKTVRAAAVGYATVLATMELQQFISSTIRAGTEIDSLKRSYGAITGSMVLARNEMSFVAKTADELGLNLEVLEKSYKGVMASSKGTSLAGKHARDIFVGINKAAAVLGMSVDDTEGSLRALTQMISKGNVQAEELRGQLGERLYGAFQKAAVAMGVSTEKLNDMLENGEVLATEMIPKLAEVLESDFGDAAVLASFRAEASFNRLGNSVLDFKRTLASSGITQSLQIIADESTKFLKSLDKEAVKTTVVVGIASIADSIAILSRTFEVAFKGVDIALQGLNVLFWETSNVIVNGPILALQQLIDLYNKIPQVPKIELPEDITKFGKSVTDEMSLARAGAVMAIEDLGEILTRPLPSSKIIELVTQTIQSLDQFDKAVKAKTNNTFDNLLHKLTADGIEKQRLINIESVKKDFQIALKLAGDNKKQVAQVQQALQIEINKINQAAFDKRQNLKEKELQSLGKYYSNLTTVEKIGWEKYGVMSDQAFDKVLVNIEKQKAALIANNMDEVTAEKIAWAAITELNEKRYAEEFALSEKLSNQKDKESSDEQTRLSKATKISTKKEIADFDSPFKDYISGLEESLDMTTLLENTTVSVFQSMEDAMLELVMTGKLGWEDLAVSAIEAFNQILIKQAVMQPLADMVGGFDFGSIGGSLSSFFASEKGNVVSGVSAYSNSVVSTPTIVPNAGKVAAYATGGALFGEAGPEAIMPLTRTSSGNLGVETSGSAKNVSLNVVNNISVKSSGDATADESLARNISDQIDTKVKSILAAEQRYGGILYGR